MRSKICVSQVLLLLFNLNIVLTIPKNGTTTDNTIVDLGNQQRLRGFRNVLPSNDTILAFLGVPYAMPPTGPKRFAPPVPAARWIGTLDALKAGPRCPQDIPLPPGLLESEDCLVLNVYTPSLHNSLPVMVWIHGGSFVLGYSHEHDGSSLAARGVVVVTINYRLGHLGFLSTGDDVMPGNYGMLDQILALKWVQDNIRVFGGDPNSVTVFGQSAGSAAVSLLVLSPRSHGLFHRAIMQSGASLTPWAVERPGTEIKMKDFTKDIAIIVGCNQTDSTALLQCLRTVTNQDLLTASSAAMKALDRVLATPRVESTFGFLPDYPVNLLKTGQFNRVNTLRGYDFGEWSYKISDPEDDGITRDEFRAHLYLFNDHLYGLYNYDAIVQLIENEYIQNLTDPMAIRAALVSAFTDFQYAAGEIMELDEILPWSASTNKHYLYEFNFPRRLENKPAWMGALHGAELPFVFKESPHMILPVDRQVSDTVQSLWTNFAKFGHPTSPGDVHGLQWGEYTTQSRNLLKITDAPAMAPIPRPSAVKLYQNIMGILHQDQQMMPSVIVG